MTVLRVLSWAFGLPVGFFLGSTSLSREVYDAQSAHCGPSKGPDSHTDSSQGATPGDAGRTVRGGRGQ